MNQLKFNFDGLKSHPRFMDIAPHIVKSFFAYHELNPHVFKLVVKYSNDLKRAGRKHYGIGAVIERIRWHLNVETFGDEFKINNNYRSCYARLLMIKDSSFEHFFQTRASPGTLDGLMRI